MNETLHLDKNYPICQKLKQNVKYSVKLYPCSFFTQHEKTHKMGEIQ